MRTIETNERRARLAIRHRLVFPASNPVEVTDAVVALHSSDPATVYLSAWARAPGTTTEDLDHALYDDRSLVRVHAMRRTMWIIPTSRARLFEVAAGAPVAVRERARLLKLVADHIEDDVGAWFERARHGVLEHLDEHEFAYADDLRQVVPELNLRFDYAGGSYGVGPRVLFQLAVEGDLIRTRPRGSWRSSVYAWTLRDRWLDDPGDEWEAEKARAEVVRLWLTSFGPGTLDDIVWWTGWGKRVTRQALSDCGAVDVDLEGVPGFVAAGDEEPVEGLGPWVAMLPGLDPTTMGWKERDWYLGEHDRALFDRNGNAGPTVWVDGRIVGGWAQRADGEIATRLLEPVADAEKQQIDELTERLREWMRGHVVVPRFRTPLDKDLAG